ncbi:unnamed protein product [Schistocephalus solidus]|uniref:BHLH domain-containing protein n=1 Tax=Schistocephalus solidus TaxID=70667 RepID=A0A183TGE4_SCHSO|nr:unnamed protein product [Schistocephalus solidus]
MLLWPPITGTQLSPVAPRSSVLLSDHDPGNRYDRRAKPYPPGCSDTPKSNRLERRMALVTRELARYKLEIAALSET